MTIDLIKKNSSGIESLLDQVMEYSQELEEMNSQAAAGQPVDSEHRKMLEESIEHSLSQVKILNNVLPELLNNISFYPKLNQPAQQPSVPATPAAKPAQVEELAYVDKNAGKQIVLAVGKKERGKFLESLSLHNLLRGKLGKKKSEDEEKKEQSIETYAAYIKASNRFFRNTANKMIAGGTFNGVRSDLIKITSPMIINSYLAVALFSTMIMLFVGLFIGVLLAVLKVSILVALLIFIGFPLITFLLFFFYPSSKRKSLEKDINQELPFLVIYMSAISTSGIEPSKLFNIIVASKDYPAIRREIKKLTNYVNFYGLDLVAALKNVSKNNPSERLSQLFDGLSSTITSGGELTEFLNKHSESLLFDYRLEREKYTRTAETFMNIYISVVIAAPMIMMMLFILMSLGGFAQGFLSPTNLGILAVMGISLLNMGFLVFLSMKQPKF